MTWFVFCYWYEPDALTDPVGLVRIWSLARRLGRLGDQVTVFPPRYASSRGHEGFRTVAIPLLPWSLFRPLSYAVCSFLAGLLAALKGKPAVVYYRWMESPHPIFLARLLGTVCVCEINGEPVPEWRGSYDGLRRRLRHWMAHKTIHRCDRLVVLTEGLRNLVINRYGASPERVLVIPSGSDTELFTPCDRLACRQRVGLDVGAEYIGFVGSFYQYQGLTCLLDAFALIREQRASVRLLLVGDGEAGRSLRERAAKLDLAGAIVWTGRVPYAQVPDLIGAMDVCAAPFSADRGETSPVKLFDYLACGRPTVASAIPAVSKIFSDGQGVVLVPPDDPSALASALLSLLENPQRAADLGRHGRRFVEERYAWDGLTERLRQWLQRDPSLPTHANSSIL